MKAFSKIGFHGSVGGNPTGLGDHLRRLDAAGIPFFVKAADGMTGVFDAQKIMKNSAVPHTAVFRRSGRYQGSGPIENPDVASYHLEPEEAAEKHWQWHKAGLPPELDKELVWVETINEPRKEVEWADWLGNFAFHSAQMMMADGYKFSAFGYSSGTPDVGAWETDGMLRYLELCQQRPDKASVALHEYSFKVEDIWFMRGDLIGRFEKLFATCDKHDIKRPKVLITEWGWTHERVPDVTTAMKHIKEVAAYYAQYPEILGAAIWYLGPGYGGIANKAQKLIKPVTDYGISATFDVPDPEPDPIIDPFPDPLPPLPPDDTPPDEEPQLQPNGRFISDITIPDDTHLTTGEIFTKTWRVENNGEAAWGDGYKFVHTDGVAMTDVTELPLPAVAPGQRIEISIQFTTPDTPGVHFTDWRFQTPDGDFFGDIIYTRIIADAPVVVSGGISDCRFVADVTIPDDMEIEAGKSFTKTWRVRNAGTRAWGAGFTLEFAGGTPMNFQSSYPAPAVAPGDTTEMSVEMRAPMTPGTHYADFRMKDDQGNSFGQILYARILVPVQAGTTLTQPLSQRDPLWANQRLGHVGSSKTIGEWGCMLTCFTMVANAFGKNITPSQLNRGMVSNGGYLNLYLTKWNALSNVYRDIVYGGKVHGPSASDLISRIDDSLAAGRPVSVQVDFTSDTPYTDNDQHWVLIVRKDGDDYRINDPWLLPAQEASLKARYGRAGRPVKEAIMSAIFYRSTAVTQPPVIIDSAPGFEVVELKTGMNVNPDAPHSNPYTNDDLKGMDWARFVFKLDARINEAERGDMRKAFAQYDPIVRAYNKMGVKTLFVINQETVWGKAPWAGGNDWNGYSRDLAAAAKQIAVHYRRYGDKVGYEIWNEGDLPHNPASVYIPPERFAGILRETAVAIRAASPNSPLVFGGLATGPEAGIAYLQQCKAALNGPWPVDAIGIHPYTRWATRAPFDWGQQYGTLGEAFDKYKAAIPDIPFWITEIGVADDREIGSQFYADIGDYMMDVYSHVAERHTDLVPVIIWFAWSDNMRNAGVVDKNGKRKSHVYPAFRAVRNRELNA